MMQPQYAPVFADIRTGFLSWQLWGRLGWRDTRLRYQRTAIGPFWATLSLGIFVVIMGVLWAHLWKMDVKVFLPFLTSGMIVWLLFSSMTIEGCAVFTGSELILKQLRVSYTMLACSGVFRNLIVFGHNLIIYVLVFIYVGLPLTWSMLLIFPGLILLCLNGIWISLVLGLICARYRDIQQLTQSLLQIAMFLTPIFWAPSQLQGRLRALADYNLFYHYVQIVRAPLMGQAPELWSWGVVCGATVVGWAITILLHARFRRRITYWL
jgi:ABC-type polysaccharide/polyol phosphate export permease